MYVIYKRTYFGKWRVYVCSTSAQYAYSTWHLLEMHRPTNKWQIRRLNAPNGWNLPE